MAPRNTRLVGHALRYEGAPHRAIDGGVRLADTGTYIIGSGGTGFAVCECGWTSEVLTSGAQRKYAHRVHKMDVASGQAGAE